MIDFDERNPLKIANLFKNRQHNDFVADIWNLATQMVHKVIMITLQSINCRRNKNETDFSGMYVKLYFVSLSNK